MNRIWPFKKKERKKEEVSWEIVGVTLGWDARPHICFKGGYYLPTSVERISYKDYFKNGDWPHDPVTGEKLPIAK